MNKALSNKPPHLNPPPTGGREEARSASGEGVHIMAFSIILLTLILDQITKAYILARIETGAIEALPFMNLVLVWNRGISFGLFNHGDPLPPILFVIISLAITAGFAIWLWRTQDRFLATGLALVIGGALGNVIDRLRFGAVIDFLDFHVAGWHWPAFNIADSAVCIGIAIVLFDGLFCGRKDKGAGHAEK